MVINSTIFRIILRDDFRTLIFRLSTTFVSFAKFMKRLGPLHFILHRLRALIFERFAEIKKLDTFIAYPNP